VVVVLKIISINHGKALIFRHGSLIIDCDFG
jgi:hypothetical protein